MTKLQLDKLNQMRQDAAMLRAERTSLLRKAELTQDCLNEIQRKIQWLEKVAA
jgi:hypothetical protein